MLRENIKGRVRRALILEIKRRIDSGEKRQDIFNELSPKYAEQDWLASLIASVPDPDDIPKIKNGTSFIFLSLCTYAAIHTISILSFMIPHIIDNAKLIIILPIAFVWPAVAFACAVQVRKYSGAWYRIAGWVAIILILKNVIGILDGKIKDPVSVTVSIAVLLMLSVSAFFALKIRKDFFPHFTFYNVKKEKGQYVLGRN